MKVKCIDNSKYSQLKSGGIYEAKLVYELDPNYKKIKKLQEYSWDQSFLNIKGFDESFWFDCRYFIKIETWRFKQLEKIL
jgi:hypothetical protein